MAGPGKTDEGNQKKRNRKQRLEGKSSTRHTGRKEPKTGSAKHRKVTKRMTLVTQKGVVWPYSDVKCDQITS